MTTEAGTDRTTNYAFLLGGLTAAIFGIILLIRREEALTLMIVLLGLWWLIQGAFMLFSVFVEREDWVWKSLIGVLGLVAGIIVMQNPDDAVTFLASTLVVVLGIIGVIIGIMAIIGSFRGGGFGALIFGVVSAAIGLLFVFNSLFTASLLVTLFAVLLLIDGVAAIWMAIKYK